MQNNYQLSRNEQAIKRLCEWFAYGCFISAVWFGDILFIGLMWDTFPDGFLRYLAVFGAVATALSVCTLMFAKRYWFTPGNQMLAAYGFGAIEIGVLILNALLAAQTAQGETFNGFMQVWHSLSPASPLLAVIGWAVVFALDESATARNVAEEARANVAETYAKYLQVAAKSDSAQQQIALGAEQAAKAFIEDVVGRAVQGEKPVKREPAKVDAPTIPFMITHGMREMLNSMGFSEDQINAMTPSQAWAEVNRGAEHKERLRASINGNGHAPVNPTVPPSQIG